MNRADYDRFVDALHAIADVVQKPRPSELAIGVYWAALGEYTLAQITAALTRHVRDTDIGQFMPKPADIIRQITGTTSDQAERVWPSVLRAIRGETAANYVVFDDPVIHQVVHDMGGLCHMGRTNEKEIPFLQREFVSRYKSLQARPMTTYPSRLRARESLITNTDQEVALIGDLQKCAEVMEGGSLVALEHMQ